MFKTKNKQLNVFFITIFSLLLFTNVTIRYQLEKNYCDGFSDGYKAGWCYKRPNCVTPVIPACPAKKVNEYTYKDGYNRGFALALSKRK